MFMHIDKQRKALRHVTRALLPKDGVGKQNLYQLEDGIVATNGISLHSARLPRIVPDMDVIRPVYLPSSTTPIMEYYAGEDPGGLKARLPSLVKQVAARNVAASVIVDAGLLRSALANLADKVTIILHGKEAPIEVSGHTSDGVDTYDVIMPCVSYGDKEVWRPKGAEKEAA